MKQAKMMNKQTEKNLWLEWRELLDITQWTNKEEARAIEIQKEF
tara:strand:- start:493 stop:624 length:132 start_codon:yes stop_codon:yes gene_type:complete